MKKKAVFFFTFLLFFACSPFSKKKRRDNILSVQKMSEVMVDINLLESALNMNVAQVDSITQKKEQLFLEILKKHHMEQKQYNENFEYYTNHLDSLDKIYQLVLIDLSKRKAKVMNEK
jgi:hypothetical protein